jgi:hypothetical protein
LPRYHTAVQPVEPHYQASVTESNIRYYEWQLTYALRLAYARKQLYRSLKSGYNSCLA